MANWFYTIISNDLPQLVCTPPRVRIREALRLAYYIFFLIILALCYDLSIIHALNVTGVLVQQ